MKEHRITRGTVQASMRDDWPADEQAYGLEQWNGQRWVPLWPEHPTFANKRAADQYGAARFADYRK